MSLAVTGRSPARPTGIPVGVSLHLDIIRFAAGMTVFLGHASGRLLGGGLFWQLSAYMQTAVMVFFVLSGFVIAYVTDERERDLVVYTQHRVARIYSVVIPALILTAACDAIGLTINPDLYYKGPWGYPEGSQVLRYVLSFFMLNQTWLAPDMGPGINGPFWSLCYEAFYYTFIAIILFKSGKARLLLFTAFALLAGPTILLMFPIWLMGFALYRFRSRVSMPPLLGLTCATVGLACLVVSPVHRAMLPDVSFGPMLRGSLLSDYLDGLAFCLHLGGVMSCERWLKARLLPASPVIRWAGSLTFALYLFHRPLIQLFAALDLGAPTSWQQRLLIFGGTFLVTATFGRQCEAWKSSLNQRLRWLRGHWTERRAA